MKLFIALSISLLFVGLNNKLIGCTCSQLYFCEYLNNNDKQIAIEATVLHHKSYVQNDAVYLSVDEIFRADVGITNIIKLYGNSQTADCQVDVLSRFPDGKKLYLIIGLQYNGQDVTHGFVNPDDIFENFWEIAPNSCLMILLDVKNDIVSGPILPEIREFPLVEFEIHLTNCDFPVDVLSSYRCEQLPFQIYPNPTTDGIINIVNLYRYTSIKRIRIFDISGRLVYTEFLEAYTFQKATIEFDYSGIYILEFQCEKNIFFDKVIVQ